MTQTAETETTRVAGRALDDEMATKVMGWEVLRVGYTGLRDGVYAESPRQVELRDWLDRVGIDSIGDYYIDVPGDTWRRVNSWSPSISMADAWGVVEKVQGFDKERDDPWWSVAVYYGQPGQVGCRVYACPPGYSIFDAGDVDAWEAQQDPRIIAHVVADTAPLSICIAALAALAASDTRGSDTREGTNV